MKFKSYMKLRTQQIADRVAKKGERFWWDYITSIRGPDSYRTAGWIKDFFTAFLRGRSHMVDILSFKAWVSGIRGTDFLKDPEWIRLKIEDINNSETHFRSHLISGFFSLAEAFDGEVKELSYLLSKLICRSRTITIDEFRNYMKAIIKIVEGGE